MLISDALSRLYLPETNEELIPDLAVHEIQLNVHLPLSEKRYRELQDDTAKDNEMTLLKEMIEKGWPERKSDVPEAIQKYWTLKDEITCIDNIMFKGHKVIIPEAQRKLMLTVVHETHLGIVKCKARAR